jgi:uncharacterized protein
MKRITIKLFLVALLFFPSITFGYYELGQPNGFVNDYAEVINLADQIKLENKLKTFAQKTGNEIAVVTINNLQNDTIENFSRRLFSDWGIGDFERNNGILILVAVEDRQMRIEVGYGLETTVTNILSSVIIQQDLQPAFKAGNFAGGIDQATSRIILLITGEKIAPINEEPNFLQKLSLIIGAISFTPFIILLAIWFSAVLGRSKSWWLGGVAGGIIALVIWLVSSFSLVYASSALALIPLGFLFDYVISKKYQEKIKEEKPIPLWLGGFTPPISNTPRSGIDNTFTGFGGGSSGGSGSSGSW